VRFERPAHRGLDRVGGGSRRLRRLPLALLGALARPRALELAPPRLELAHRHLHLLRRGACVGEQLGQLRLRLEQLPPHRVDGAADPPRGRRHLRGEPLALLGGGEQARRGGEVPQLSLLRAHRLALLARRAQQRLRVLLQPQVRLPRRSREGGRRRRDRAKSGAIGRDRARSVHLAGLG
jgi:hypothetical protein